jgi:hypothetical protein
MDGNSKLVSYLAILPLVVMVATFALVLREPVDTAGMVVLALAAAFFVLSAIMFTGLGTKIVAGFIHDSSEENTRYDSRIVSTGVGMILLGAGIMAAISLLGQTFLYVGVLVLIVLIFVGVIYIAEYSKE